MLVAEKRQYADTYIPYPAEEELPVSIPRTKAKSKAKTHVLKKVWHIFLVLAGFAVCSYTVARFAVIAQNQQEISTLEAALTQEESMQEYLELELANRMGLDRVEEYAKNDLEMYYPDKEQVVYVELPEMKNENEIEGTEIASEGKESLWNKIIGLLD
ncbi:MAG: cell division protein FtsL [Clostridiales bacterium]|nr:cell division protein FtsL [Clostridiales bacterium]